MWLSKFWTRLFRRNKRRDLLIAPLSPKQAVARIIGRPPGTAGCAHQWVPAKWDEEKWGPIRGMTLLGPVERIGSMYVWEKRAQACGKCGETKIEETGFYD